MKEIKAVTFEKANASMVPNLVRNSNGDEEMTRYLTEAIEASDVCWVAFADGEAGCVWGLRIQNIILGHAYIWVHLTNVAKENEIRFLRGASKLVCAMSYQFRYIYGHIDPREPKAKRWIPWLGFQIGGEQDFITTDGKNLKANVFWMGER